MTEETTTDQPTTDARAEPPVTDTPRPRTRSWFAHPARVCMSYWQHWRFSMELAVVFAVAAMRAAVHAFVPDRCVDSSSTAVRDAARRLVSAGCRP